MFRVKIAPDCRWPVVVVAGRQFTAQPQELAAVSEEILNSPLLQVAEITEEAKDDQDGKDQGNDNGSRRQRSR